MRWSLDELYTSFESEELKRDMEECPRAIEKLKAWTDTNLNSKDNAAGKVEEFIRQQNYLEDLPDIKCGSKK